MGGIPTSGAAMDLAEARQALCGSMAETKSVLVFMPPGLAMSSATPHVVVRYWGPNDAIPVPGWLQDE